MTVKGDGPEAPWPREVELTAAVLGQLGGEVEITRPQSGRYLVTHTTDRVHLEMIYTRRAHTHRLAFSSTLSVDGRPRPLLPDPEAYARLLKQPDNPHPERRPVKLLPEVAEADRAQWPEALATMVDTVNERNGESVGLRVGTVADHGEARFVLEAEHPLEPGARLHLYFSAEGHMLSGAAVDGYGGDAVMGATSVAELIQVWFGTRSAVPVPPVRPDVVKADTTGAVTNSVSVRRASVRRV